MKAKVWEGLKIVSSVRRDAITAVLVKRLAEGSSVRQQSFSSFFPFAKKQMILKLATEELSLFRPSMDRAFQFANGHDLSGKLFTRSTLRD
jgi:hypothetical protein